MSDSIETVETTTDTLPFSEKKQQAILGHLLTDTKFFARCRHIIFPEWFINSYHTMVWKEARQFADTYGRPPTEAEIKELEVFFRLDPQTRGAINTAIHVAIQQTQHFKLDALEDEIENWLHSRMFAEGLKEAYSLYNKQQFDKGYHTIKQTIKDIDTTSIKPTKAMSWSDPIGMLEEQVKVRENALTFGIDAFDKLLLPDAAFGSLLPGDTTVLLAPTGVGKTSTMITVACHNIKRRKHILFISHEGRGSDLQEKMWCSILDCAKSEIVTKLKADPQKAALLSKVMEECLIYMPMNAPGLTVEEVETSIRGAVEEHYFKYGKGFDLLIDDYPSKLSTNSIKSGNYQKRNVDEYVYGFFVAMALEYNCHALVAIQGNRESSKINKNRRGSDYRLLTGEDAHESFGPVQTATNLISINRDPIAEARGRVTYYISKSRSSEIGWAVCCKSNYGHCITHSNKMGCTYYKGTSPMTDHIDQLFEQHKNGQIPQDKVH